MLSRLCFGSLEKLTGEERAQVGLLSAHREVREKGALLGTGSGDKPVPLPTASLTASLLGTLRVEEEIKGSCPRRGVGEL